VWEADDGVVRAQEVQAIDCMITTAIPSSTTVCISTEREREREREREETIEIGV